MGQRLTKFARVMDAKGLKPEEIAYKSGYSVGYIYKLRRGDIDPSLRAAKKIARVMGETILIFDDADCPEATVACEEVAV